MRKGIFYTGVIVFILGVLAFFLSGSRSGPNLEPTVPLLYGTSQGMWMLLGIAGVVIIIIGGVMKEKRKKKS